MPISVNRIQGEPLADGGAEPFAGSVPGAAHREDRPFRPAARAFRAFVRGSRAAAGLELAFGATALIAAAALCFDLYSLVAADTAGARIAATMADYVSRGPDTDGGTLDGKALEDLARFLHEEELGVPSHLAFAITALQKSSGSRRAVEVLWLDDSIRFGKPEVTEKLAKECPRYVERKGKKGKRLAARLPADFRKGMADGEVVVIVEVCAQLSREGALTGRLFGGARLYRHHALPARLFRQSLPAPVHALRQGSGDGGGPHAPAAPTLFADAGPAFPFRADLTPPRAGSSRGGTDAEARA